MTALHSTLRKQLESAVTKARPIAEEAARAALTVLAVERPDALPGQSKESRDLRTALRAKAKVLGNGVREEGWTPLVEEIAYQQWHRMLFARFLAENNLLLHPSGVAVTLDDCAELAREEGIDDQWEVAARYAAAMLPGLFRADNPTVQIRFAPEGQLKLEKLLADLPLDIFTSDDGLGWVYQFWQKEKKDQINASVKASDKKIGAAEIGPVTQLFTEDYMVRFLLENSLGSWWAARHPDSPLLAQWDYLRFAADGTPAAGSFPGWPERVAEVTVMDPCCGSGHFLVAAFDMIRQMRMEEEGLSASVAANAVLRDNLFGLEIDPRCTQIATFAVALAAWKSGGQPDQFAPQVACSGIAAGGTFEDWARLGGKDDSLRYALEEMYRLFKDAPELGSLIDPMRSLETGRAYQRGFQIVSWDALATKLDRAYSSDPESIVFVNALSETAHAATLLGRRYTFVATNVPYRGAGSLDPYLRKKVPSHLADYDADLSSLFSARVIDFTVDSGSYCLVVPQTQLFLKTFESLRKFQLTAQTWNVVAALGKGSFAEITGEVVQPVLLIMTNDAPSMNHRFLTIDISDRKGFFENSRSLIDAKVTSLDQAAQLRLPGTKMNTKNLEISTSYLNQFAASIEGLSTGDGARYQRQFWEIQSIDRNEWTVIQRGPEVTLPYGGCTDIVRWQQGSGELSRDSGARIQGHFAWGKDAVLISKNGTIRASLYLKGLFDKSCAVVLPEDPSMVKAIWSYCSSPLYPRNVKEIDKKVAVATASVVQVPFDLNHWQRVAEEQYPNGLPEPYSDDPTQWLFKGNVDGSKAPMQVAVARLLGYRWPEQAEDALDALADTDGIVPLPSLRAEPAAAERLRVFLAAAYGDDWSHETLDGLLAEAGFAGKPLAEWLLSAKKGFFDQHVSLFHHRPFIWQITDGAVNGFSALINYHKLTAANLDRLIHSYLGDWIEGQRRQQATGVAGADDRLTKALDLQAKLIAIQTGEPPYDIYVRWKPRDKQSIGWDPDLNDGVRINIRPFITAGILQAPVNAKWGVDRGANPTGSDVQRWAAEAWSVAVNKADFDNRDGTTRVNDLHLTREVKRAARDRAQS